MDLARYPTDVSDCYLSPQDLFTPDDRTPRLTVPGFSGTADVRISMVLLYSSFIAIQASVGSNISVTACSVQAIKQSVVANMPHCLIPTRESRVENSSWTPLLTSQQQMQASTLRYEVIKSRIDHYWDKIDMKFLCELGVFWCAYTYWHTGDVLHEKQENKKILKSRVVVWFKKRWKIWWFRYKYVSDDSSVVNGKTEDER